ncbi:MAG: bromodomain-containing protein [Candidatus Pacebacteria bacterium]|nr:bromodomain-containing protein [Candidatus Paceibacterota bacterium]
MKLSAGKYKTPSEFLQDVQLIWSNAMTYNHAESVSCHYRADTTRV